jgi:hypothetical protein
MNPKQEAVTGNAQDILYWYADLGGILENTSLPKSKPLLPLFEAITNSLDSLEDYSPLEPTIKVYILRNASETTSHSTGAGRPSLASITGFRVEDNGPGFTDSNLVSFRTYSSRRKASRGGKGVGRFLWLKAFDEVQIVSIFHRDNKAYRREFIFSVEHATDPVPKATEISFSPPSTTVELRGFCSELQKSTPASGAVIATRFIEHFLDYFAAEKMPEILLIDEGDDDPICLKRLYQEKFKKDSETLYFDAKNYNFALRLFKLYHGEVTAHRLHLCARGREVEQEGLKQYFPDLVNRLGDDGDRFFLSAFVSGDFLDERVNRERTRFEFDDDSQQSGMFPDSFLTKSDFTGSLRGKLHERLRNYLEPLQQEKVDIIKKYVHTKAPRYIPLLKARGTRLAEMPPNWDERKMEEALAREYFEHTREIREDTAKILSKDNKVLNTDDYKNTLRNLLSRVGDVERCQLAEYVAHRRVILDFFEKAMEQKDDGKFVLEEYIHDLICPRHVTSDDFLSLESVNLWVIDERFSFHNYLASDKPHKKVVPLQAKDGDKRTDILLLNTPHAFTEDQAPYHSVVIIEFKRPQRNDYTFYDNPIDQCVGYVQDFMNGDVTDCRGRKIPSGPQRQFFVHVLCDETKTLQNVIRKYSLQRTHDDLGFFGYIDGLKTYIQLHTFDKLLIDAKRRNQILFERLCIE